MSKIAYNACFGGFNLSRAAVLRAREITGDPSWGGACIIGDTWEDSDLPVDCDYGARPDDRTDPVVIQVIEELGDEANGMCAKLCIAELPSGTRYRIDEYDGLESVETEDTYEWKVAP